MSSYAFGVLFRRPPLAFCAVLTAIALSVPSVVAQQVDDAIVVGTVFDSSHAAVTGAVVKLTHLATNAVTEVRTDARGEYHTQSLKIGEYAITVGADGFKQSNQRGVVLEIGDVRKLDVVLEVGQTSESVNVEAEAPLLHRREVSGLHFFQIFALVHQGSGVEADHLRLEDIAGRQYALP